MFILVWNHCSTTTNTELPWCFIIFAKTPCICFKSCMPNFFANTGSHYCLKLSRLAGFGSLLDGCVVGRRSERVPSYIRARGFANFAHFRSLVYTLTFCITRWSRLHRHITSNTKKGRVVWWMLMSHALKQNYTSEGCGERLRHSVNILMAHGRRVADNCVLFSECSDELDTDLSFHQDWTPFMVVNTQSRSKSIRIPQLLHRIVLRNESLNKHSFSMWGNHKNKVVVKN